MFEKNELRGELARHGVSYENLAQLLGTTEATISKKMNGSSHWKIEEVVILAKLIGMEKVCEIFFNREVR